MMSNEIYDYIVEQELDTSDAAALLEQLQAVTVTVDRDKEEVLNWLINEGVIDSIGEVIFSDADVAVRAQMQTALVYLQSKIPTLNPSNPKLAALIGGLRAMGKVTSEQVAAFWALFDSPRWSNLTIEQVRGALNTPKIEQCESELAAIQAEYEAAVTPIVTRRDAWEQVKLKLQNGEDAELPE